MNDFPPAASSTDDLGGPGVEGVFDELLDDRSRPFDDLARGDLLRDFGRQNVDAVHRPSSFTISPEVPRSVTRVMTVLIDEPSLAPVGGTRTSI